MPLFLLLIIPLCNLGLAATNDDPNQQAECGKKHDNKDIKRNGAVSEKMPCVSPDLHLIIIPPNWVNRKGGILYLTQWRATMRGEQYSAILATSTNHRPWKRPFPPYEGVAAALFTVDCSLFTVH
ncbi:MAG TPA: hypothetical protein VEV84_10360 [Pyrinomonadaceae bacterium]|nr:hypothetical protein [Pyrinomonadaceae bacterium]